MPIRQRKLNRFKDFDYSTPGWYYVTICTKDRIKWFGEIENNRMVLNGYGNIVSNVWNQISKYYNGVSIDESVIMPNHLHGIIIIGVSVGDEQCSSLEGNIHFLRQNDVQGQNNVQSLRGKIITDCYQKS